MSKYQEHRDMVVYLLEILKKNGVDEGDKEKIRKIINELPMKTENQKNRFIKYYGLQKGSKRMIYQEIANEENRSTSAIRCSVISITIALFRTDEQSFKIIENLYNKYLNLEAKD